VRVRKAKETQKKDSFMKMITLNIFINVAVLVFACIAGASSAYACQGTSKSAQGTGTGNGDTASASQYAAEIAATHNALMEFTDISKASCSWAEDPSTTESGGVWYSTATVTCVVKLCSSNS
jgi:hypothetical protein